MVAAQAAVVKAQRATRAAIDDQWQSVLGRLGYRSPLAGIDDFRDGGVLPFPMHISHAIVSCGGFFGCITCGALSSGFQCGPFADPCRHRITAGSKWRVHGLAGGKLPHFAKSWPDESIDPQPWLLTAGQRAWEVEPRRAAAMTVVSPDVDVVAVPPVPHVAGAPAPGPGRGRGRRSRKNAALHFGRGRHGGVPERKGVQQHAGGEGAHRRHKFSSELGEAVCALVQDKTVFKG